MQSSQQKAQHDSVQACVCGPWVSWEQEIFLSLNLCGQWRDRVKVVWSATIQQRDSNHWVFKGVVKREFSFRCLFYLYILQIWWPRNSNKCIYFTLFNMKPPKWELPLFDSLASGKSVTFRSLLVKCLFGTFLDLLCRVKDYHTSVTLSYVYECKVMESKVYSGLTPPTSPKRLGNLLCIMQGIFLQYILELT